MVGIYGIGVSAQGDSYHSNVGIPINFAELHVSTITLEPEESGFFEPIPFLVNTLGTMSPLAGFFKTVNGIGDAVSIAGIITQNEAIADIGEQINVGKQVENLLNLASPGMVDALNKIFELDGDLKDFEIEEDFIIYGLASGDSQDIIELNIAGPTDTGNSKDAITPDMDVETQILKLQNQSQFYRQMLCETDLNDVVVSGESFNELQIYKVYFEVAAHINLVIDQINLLHPTYGVAEKYVLPDFSTATDQQLKDAAILLQQEMCPAFNSLFNRFEALLYAEALKYAKTSSCCLTSDSDNEDGQDGFVLDQIQWDRLIDSLNIPRTFVSLQEDEY